MYHCLWCRDQNEKEPYREIGSSISAISMEVREADANGEEEREGEGRRRKQQGESWRENDDREEGRREGERTGGPMNRRGEVSGTDPDYLCVLSLYCQVEGGLLVDVLDVQTSASLWWKTQNH